MAARPGEENVATLFGDIHYFYGPPTAVPPHHRFDKGSYVYLFENAEHRRARIEIANQPGTDGQDAFEGFLDRTRVRYSYSQQCLVNITVEGVPGPPIDTSQWHLPTFDPRNEIKYHYKLHSLDIYFWTQTDALHFVNGIRRVLPAAQVEVADEPAPPSHAHSHSQDMAPLVQKLEKAAISDPRVQQQGIPSFAPPPTSASAGQNDSPQSFAPMPYNPAAPPEAEKYQHREKTPPPEDSGHNPLAAAMARDHGAPFTPAYGQTTFPTQSGVPGVPPTQFAHLQRASTMPASPGLVSPYGANFPGSPGFAPPPTAPTAAHHHQQQHHQPTPPPPAAQAVPGVPAPPPGGYSQFSYNNSNSNNAHHQALPAGSEYSIHQQLYRPTEQEHAAKYGDYKPKAEGQHSKLGQGAERLERGVTGMLKKFEKKFA
ncbi:hypothetical protein SAMD00023353_7700490 [Rosellinia necatrix]|uniref:RNA recognition motif-containing protein n=1 Tax=Rosellinia necatrix TaxID=77044 RepID=A0A1W2TU93_ROSNE|nr:hypothetical protein SAMD00023353_7700490 [Rosellinia necatrix]